MISNPCNWFVSGSNRKEFTYEGGSTLYHFSARDSGISQYHNFNVVFFANDIIHAKDVLRRMLNFRIDCEKEYCRERTHDFLEESIKANIAFAYFVLNNEEKWIITTAPTNQLYKVCWASNDTLLA